MGKTRKKVHQSAMPSTMRSDTNNQVQPNKEGKNKRKSSNGTADSILVKRQSLQEVQNAEQADSEIHDVDDFPVNTTPEMVSAPCDNTRMEEYGITNRIFTISDAGDAIVVLLENEEVVLQGVCDLRVLSGSADILGYHLHESEQFTRVYSPSSNSLLTITNICEKSQTFQLDCLKFLCESTTGKSILEMCKNLKQLSVIHIKQSKSVVLKFVTSFTPFQSLLRCSSKTDRGAYVIENTGVTMVTDPLANRFIVSADYQFVKESVLKCLEEGEKKPVIAICGGKNVGKSTLCRYITNILLNRVQEVAFLECDVGQTEFTVSGCVSLTVVKSPLLGPPFTHLKHPKECVYYGRLSPADDPSTYMECVKELYQHYTRDLAHLPLIVNTMGWNKGLGIHLLIDSLRTVQPNFVIQMDVSRQAHNLPSMRAGCVASTPGWITAMPPPQESGLDYKFAIISSPVIRHQEFHEKLKAPDHRHLSLLAYFGPMSVQGSLATCQPLSVAWAQLAVYICHTEVPQTQLLYALNASVVALYKVPSDMICKSDVEDYPCLLSHQPKTGCLGFGIIRGIDPVKKVFYIITPVLKHQLNKVNALVRGALDLPPQLLLKQKSLDLPPYVDCTKDGVGGSGVKPRRRLVRHFKALPDRNME